MKWISNLEGCLLRRIMAIGVLCLLFMVSSSQPSYSCGCGPGICFCCGAFVCPIVNSEPIEDTALQAGGLALDIQTSYWGMIEQVLEESLGGVSSATSKSLALTGAAQNQTVTTAIQGLNANATQNVTAAALAGATGDGTPPRTAVAAITARLGGEVAQAGTAAQVVTDALVYMGTIAGAGASADTSSPAYIAYEINDLCQLGFLGNFRYGALVSKMGCVTNDHYLDADMKLSSLLDHLQFPLPNQDNIHIAKDGHLVFSTLSSVNSSPLSPNSGSGTVSATETPPGSGLGSEMDFVAAYKFCEHLRTPLPTPSHNSGTVTVSDLVSIKNDRDRSAIRAAPETECMRALAYRTACPNITAGQLTGTAGASTLTCHDLQYAVCQRLTASFADGGLNLSMLSSNPLYSQALAHCDQLGLSQAMAEAIIAHKCQDDSFMINLPVILGGKAADVEQVISFECPKLESDYEKKMSTERKLMQKALNSMMRARSLGGGEQGSRSVTP